MSAQEKRRSKLLAMSRRHENVIATTPENIFYLTNFWGSALGVVKADRTVLVTTPLEKERASDTAIEAEVIGAPTNSALWRVASSHLSPGSVAGDAAIPVDRVESVPALFLRARRRKDSEEVRRIKSASQKIDALFSHIEKKLEPGMSEREAAAELMKGAVIEGLTPLGGGASLSPIIVASGENGCYPHAELTDRKLRPGELVTIDVFFRFEGYCSDSTRTFAMKGVSSEVRRAYDSVLEAQREGIRMARPGQLCAAVHRRVVGGLKRGGLAKYFTHGTGHGVGIDIHELPRVASTSEDKLRARDVVTIEPGVYLPGRFGIRIEDTVLVEEKPVVLTRYPTELTTVG